MKDYIEIRKDNRYKDGNIVMKDGVLVGNKRTVNLKPYNAPGMLNPPIVVSKALAKAIKGQL